MFQEVARTDEEQSNLHTMVNDIMDLVKIDKKFKKIVKSIDKIMEMQYHKKYNIYYNII